MERVAMIEEVSSSCSGDIVGVRNGSMVLFWCVWRADLHLMLDGYACTLKC